jgi:hypothetical protein
MSNLPHVARAKAIPALGRITGKRVAPEALQEKVRALIAREGLLRASRILGLTRGATASITLPVLIHPGTIAQAQAALAGLA